MKPEKIMKPNQILAEGNDAYYFLRNFLTGKRIENIQIMNYGGIDDLTRFLVSLSKQDDYDSIQSIIIARDAETSAGSAIQSVNGSLKKAGLIDSDIAAFKIAGKNIKAGIMLFPGLDENGKIYDTGTLEDLCVKLLKNQDIIKTVIPYYNEFQEKYGTFKKPHKNKLHIPLSFTDKFVGFKIGDTAKAEGFDFDSPWFAPFLEIMTQISAYGGAP
jgi:hypothetical protein